MNGTGIQTDPYIITNADELYEMETLGGKNVYFRLDADIDFNGTEYAKDYVPIPLKCAEFDGNGHTIRNIYCNYTESGSRAAVFELFSTAYAASTVILKGLTVENAYVKAERAAFFDDYNGSSYISVQNCTFSCTVCLTDSLSNTSSTSRSLMNTYGQRIPSFDLCTLIFTAELIRQYPLIASGSIVRSQIKLNMSCLSQRLHSDTTSARDALFSKVNISDSYILGNISVDGEENDFIFANGGKHDTFYQIIGYKGISNVYWDTVFGGVCFYSTDKAEGVSISNEYTASEPYAAYLYALTDEQCRDADHLRSIGYIAEGSD